MKKGKVFAVAGVTLLAAGLLAACSSSNTSKASSGEDKNYGYVYTTDPTTLDYTVSSKSATQDLTTNIVDGLMENDKYGNLVPSLAEDWSVSKDGLTYTYKIRKGVKWVTNEGEEYAELKAQDFVTGLQHAADFKSGTKYLVEGLIKNFSEYEAGEVPFDQVGVEAVDDYTLKYTLEKPASYFYSLTTYGILFPINEDFLNSKGPDVS